MKSFVLTVVLFLCGICSAQPDLSKFVISLEPAIEADSFFTSDSIWRGADGAASIDLGNGKILWLFSDSFICRDESRAREHSDMIRNSIAIQSGYDLNTASIKFFWDRSKKKPQAFFRIPGKFWFWTGHGIRIRDRLIVFLMKQHGVKTGLGFETLGWYAALVSNPDEEPAHWKMQYIEGPETFGYVPGSAAVLKDDKFLYAFGAVEPSTHEVYLIRWDLNEAYRGNLEHPAWWINGLWTERKTKNPVPEPLFIGGTEYSVYRDAALKKYIQIQSFGFGEATIGIRMADRLEGPWSKELMLYKPEYPGVVKPLMYSVKAHPELSADRMYVTYNVNSFDFGELVRNQTIYYPKFTRLKIAAK